MAQEKYFFDNKYSSIQKYSDAEISDIIKDYIENDYSKSAVIEKYPKIKPHSSFSKDFPYESTDEVCPNCSHLIYSKPQKLGGMIKYLKLCRNCGHNFTYECSCNYCVKNREKEKLEFDEKFKNYWDKEIGREFNSPYPLEDLAILDEIKLYWLVDLFYNPEENQIDFISVDDYQISLDGTYYSNQSSILQQFIERKILKPLCIYNSEFRWLPTCFFVKEQSKLFKWEVNLSSKGEGIDTRTFIKNSSTSQYSEDILLLLWKRIFKEEISNYLIEKKGYYGFVELDEFTIELLCDLLVTKYSLSRSFSIIHEAMGTTSKYVLFCKPKEVEKSGYFLQKISERLLQDEDSRLFSEYERSQDPPVSDFNLFILKKILRIEHIYLNVNFEKIRSIYYE